MCAPRYDLSSLRWVVHAAAPCPPEVKRAMIEWLGPIVAEYYGGTETGPVVFCTSEEWLAHPGTVGRPIEQAVVKILDADGRSSPRASRARSTCGSTSWPDFTYAGDEEKRRSVERDGLVSCGDIGYLDADGYLYLNDRRSDMVISGGVNIYPAEIEACLLSLPGVRDCAVFGIPDDEFGEALAAHVELHDGARLSADAVRDHVRSKLAGLQDAARGRVQRLAAARGLRQDLQAPPARALLARARARDLDRHSRLDAARARVYSRRCAGRRSACRGGGQRRCSPSLRCMHRLAVGPGRLLGRGLRARRPCPLCVQRSEQRHRAVPFLDPQRQHPLPLDAAPEQRRLRAARHRPRLPAAPDGPRQEDQTEPQAQGRNAAHKPAGRVPGKSLLP